MNNITIPGVRRKLHTSATRRFLVVSVYDGRPKVETSSDDRVAARRLITRYAAEFGACTTLYLIDQEGGE